MINDYKLTLTRKSILLLTLFTVITVEYCIAQKKLIDTSVYDKWPSLAHPTLHENGDYLKFDIINSEGTILKTIFKSTNSTWSYQIPAGNNTIFKSKLALTKTDDDELLVIHLGVDSIQRIPNVSSFKVSDASETGFLAVLGADSLKKLMIYQTNTLQPVLTVFHVKGYSFSKSGKFLLIQSRIIENNNRFDALTLISLTNLKTTNIWQGDHLTAFAISSNDERIAIIGQKKYQSDYKNEIFVVDRNLNTTTSHFINSPLNNSGWHISDNSLNFSTNGKQLFYNIDQKVNAAIKHNYERNKVSVDVWNYKDSVIQSIQLNRLASIIPKEYNTAVLNIENSTSYLLNETDQIEVGYSFRQAMSYNLDYVIVCNNTFDIDFFLSEKNSPTFWLVSTKDGSKQVIAKGLKSGGQNSMWMSPKGGFIVFYDPQKNNFYSYDVKNRIVREIGKTIKTNLIEDLSENGYTQKIPFGIAGWLTNDSSVFIYDQFDIWQIDLYSNKLQKNITNGYGRKNNIIFRLMKFDPEVMNHPVIKDRERLILSAFNVKTKENGFYSTITYTNLDPVKLTMGSYIYHLPFRSNSTQFIQSPFKPLKSKTKEIYLVQRMSSTESPNYFLSADFKNFKKITNLHPEKEYNWLKTELVKWDNPNGTPSLGILYKPENFDPQKKYPLIVYVYENISDGLHKFLTPYWSMGVLDIPTYVSNGYLILTPDIHYKSGNPGPSVMTSIKALWNKLTTLRFVDTAKIGIQGHSFGGYEVNYIVTHTNVFKAAYSGAGVSNFTSGYGSIGFENDKSMQILYELGQNRMGAPLCNKINSYINNSPIFSAGQMNTPLLLMNNKLDYAVPFSQGLEFFLTLRRYNKRVWLLQYDLGLHTISGKEAVADFTIRVDQFFNHFLKGFPSPKWLEYGVPAKFKQFNSGFEVINERENN